jgi:hypothetical protein
MTFQTMSRKEADEKIEWLEGALTVSLTAWQKELFAAMLMYPDMKFELGHSRSPRRGLHPDLVIYDEVTYDHGR